MLSSATGTNIINVLISELYIVSRNCLDTDLLSLVPYGVQTAGKWTERVNVVTPPTDKPDVWVWSAELLLTLWFETSLAFGCLCIFHFLSSSWPRLQPRYCPWDVCFGWAFWTHLVLNAVVKSRAVAAVCGFLNLVSIYFLYSWQKWLAARWGSWIKHLWVTLCNFTAEAKPNLCMK